MLRRVVIPPFGRPPDEYDPQYLADVTRAYSVLMELLMQRGEGQFSKVFLANLVSSPTSTLEAHEVFEDSGFLKVAQADGALPGAAPRLGYNAVTSAYTLTDDDAVVDCTANSFTVTLPTAVGAAGRQYVVKNSGNGTIFVDAAGAETIDGQLTQTLSQYDAIKLVSTGTNWIII